MSPNSTTNSLVFSPDAGIRFGGLRFANVPVILQVDGTPLIEIVQNNEISRTTRFTIFSNDGTLLASAVGTCLYCTAEGVKAGLEMQYPARETICVIGGQILFEIRRVAAAALTVTAELFSPTGLLIRSNNLIPFGTFAKDGTALAVAEAGDRRIKNIRVGLSVTENGRTITVGAR